MSAAEVFLDTNVLLHLLSTDTGKANRAEALVEAGGVISVQVLNEFVSVATRKLAMQMTEIREILTAVRASCVIVPLSLATHDLALDLAERFRVSFYDSLILAAAELAQCRTVYSEDMQHGQKIAGVTIRNPFVRQQG
jgi:predicted nucleic acid-binding protein